MWLCAVVVVRLRRFRVGGLLVTLLSVLLIFSVTTYASNAAAVAVNANDPANACFTCNNVLDRCVGGGTRVAIGTISANNSGSGVRNVSTNSCRLNAIRSSIVRCTCANAHSFRDRNGVASFHAITNLCTRTIRLIAIGPSVGSITSLGNGGISVNTPNSNICFGTVSILTTTNLSRTSVVPRLRGFSRDTSTLGSNGVSTTFVITNTPAPTVSRLYVAGSGAEVIPVSNTVTRGLVGSGAFCSICGVPTGACSGRTTRMAAIAIGTALVISTGTSRSTICRLATTVFSGVRTVAGRRGGNTRLDLRGTARNLAIPFRTNTTGCFRRGKVAMTAGWFALGWG